MQSIPSLQQARTSIRLAGEIGCTGGPGEVLLGVCATLENAGISYCITHGYEEYPQRITSDVDFIISADVSPQRLAALLHEDRFFIGAEVMRRRPPTFILAGKSANGSPCFLVVDFCSAYDVEGLQYYTASEVLLHRHKQQHFYVPSSSLDFGCYLVRRIAKGSIDDKQGQRLGRLYGQDVAGCRQHIARFWDAGSRVLIESAALSGDWKSVRRRLSALRDELRRRALRRTPRWPLAVDRARRCWQPDGVHIVFLGPDGAGKSSVVRAVASDWAGGFARTSHYGFAPGLLHRLLGRSFQANPHPHAASPRSFLASVTRAVTYWFLNATLGYAATIRVDLIRSALVLNDRHFVDALVDPKRYRYAGPSWLLRLIWRLSPKPDLVILLDAPAEVLQARKREVPFEETVRQRDAYLALVRHMGCGRVVNAAQPLDQVVRDVNGIILQHLSARNALRMQSKYVFHGLRPAACPQAKDEPLPHSIRGTEQ